MRQTRTGKKSGMMHLAIFDNQNFLLSALRLDSATRQIFKCGDTQSSMVAASLGWILLVCKRGSVPILVVLQDQANTCQGRSKLLDPSPFQKSV